MRRVGTATRVQKGSVCLKENSDFSGIHLVKIRIPFLVINRICESGECGDNTCFRKLVSV